MTWVETNKESPTYISIKDLETVTLEYGLIEFASKALEELIKAVRKTKNACVELFRSVLLTYN